MSNGPAASNSLGLIGVELYRLHVGSVSATNFVFAAVQTDWRYLAGDSFFDDSSSEDDFRSLEGGGQPGSRRLRNRFWADQTRIPSSLFAYYSSDPGRRSDRRRQDQRPSGNVCAQLA